MLTVLVIALLSVVVVSADVCTKTWTVVPAGGIMSTPDCNLFSGDVTLQSVCTVSTNANDNVVVRWYYSMEEHLAGRNGSIVESDMRIRVNSTCLRSTLCSADLTISNIEPSHEGYYWCEVDKESSGMLASFPSTVLRINACNTFHSDCMKKKTYHTNINNNSGRCAVSTMSQTRNLTFVDLQDCLSTTSQPTTTETNISDKPMATTAAKVDATTIGDGKTSPLFLETTAMSSAMSTSLAVSTSMPVASTVGTESFSSLDEVEASTALSGDDGAALPLTLIVPIVGAGVGVMLCVVAILLALVLAVQCRKKTGKGEITPNSAVNRGYSAEELTSSTAPMIQRYRGANQVQAPVQQVPANFTLATSSSEINPPNQRGPQIVRPTPPQDDQYEDVEVNTSAGTARIKLSSNQQHQYASVVEREDYNHLTRTESSSHNVVPGAPFSRMSGSPHCLSESGGSGIFDSPKYSQSTRMHQHVDIYRLESSDSTSGSGNQTREQWLSKVPLETHSEDSTTGLHNSSKVTSVGYHNDEAKHLTSTSALPSSRPYTKVAANTQDNVEGNYTQRIVSTDEQYVSEQGHVYQVLEKSNDSSSPPTQQNSSDQPVPGSIVGERYVGDKGHLYHILEDPGSKKDATKSQVCNAEDDNIYHVLEDPQQAAGNSEVSSDENQPIYHILEGPANGEVQSKAAVVSSELGEDDAFLEPEYDTIELEQGQKNRSHRSDYNVIERPEMHRNSLAQQPEQLFHVGKNLDRQALLRESSSTSLQTRPHPYNVIERNTSDTSLLRHKQAASKEQLVPPPNYSSLNLDKSARKERKFKIEACNPFYEDIDIDKEGSEQCPDGDAQATLALSNGLDNAIYHAVL